MSKLVENFLTTSTASKVLLERYTKYDSNFDEKVSQILMKGSSGIYILSLYNFLYEFETTVPFIVQDGIGILLPTNLTLGEGTRLQRWQAYLSYLRNNISTPQMLRDSLARLTENRIGVRGDNKWYVVFHYMRPLSSGLDNDGLSFGSCVGDGGDRQGGGPGTTKPEQVNNCVTSTGAAATWCSTD